MGAVNGTSADILYANAGNPTGLEEEIRWRVNRGRFDSASENKTRNTTYTDVPASAGPLAPNQSLTLSARHQSEDMAKNNLFQHATVPGSAYYNPVTQSQPWDRMTAEGYLWNRAAENIAAGYAGAETTYLAWWNSAGHRENMYDPALREIGNGYYYWAASTYGRYYTMDLGSSGVTAFFTDTLFRDANGNGVYDSGEGLPGIAIRLAVGSQRQSAYAVSSATGSFAVPIQSIPAGAMVSVILSNTATTNVTLTLPRDYFSLTNFTLAAGQERSYGVFTQPASTANVGLRSVTARTSSIVSPQLGITKAGQGLTLQWVSQSGLRYQPQWSRDSLTWSNLTTAPQTGTGGTLTFVDTTVADRRFYRLSILGQ
jgi:hypothetical protein